ncbi:Hypothetical predicted protein [Octopus vulgaris]|uniref:Uncharacterized protein n=1 Tax=Octopus vulgaris TaxID=6645 RepID=A0AA36AQV7_OCTVU|nr:Hypothetical predicted protein [Octopus vulgaris]
MNSINITALLPHTSETIEENLAIFVADLNGHCNYIFCSVPNAINTSLNLECSGGEIGDFAYDAGIDLGVVVAEDGCGGGIGGCSNGCSGGCEDDSDIDSL